MTEPTKTQRILDELDGHERTASDLAGILELDANRVSALLANLMRRGHVTRRDGEGRAGLYRLADDGQPTQRRVETPSVRPSARALSDATPFGSTPPAEPDEAEPAPPARVHELIPKFSRLAPNTRIAIEPTTTAARFGIFSDGSMSIELGSARIELAPNDVDALHAFMGRAA